MGPSTNVLTPIVAGIHYDDLDRIFRLKITFQVETPLGTFEREIIVTASDLAGIIAQVVQIWSGASPTSEVGTLNFPLGDLTALGTELGALVPGVEGLVTPPTPPAGDATVDPDLGTYDGTVGALAGTDWGQTPVVPS